MLPLRAMEPPVSLDLTDVFGSFFPWSKHFQILMVSSAAELATLVPSGDIVRHKIRLVCPIMYKNPTCYTSYIHLSGSHQT